LKSTLSHPQKEDNLSKTIRFLGEDWTTARWIDARERLSMLAEGQADVVYRDEVGRYTLEKTAKTDGTIRVRVYAPEESFDLPGLSRESPTGLTMADMMRNAAGAVDTPKRRIIYALRDKQEAGAKPIPAAIRCYGHDRENKPRADLVGNAVDKSMSRVEQWPLASENNRSVTVTPGRIIGLRVVPCLA
jgi:hypothetical protein